MARLAFLTFGILKAPFGHEDVKGFTDRIPDVFETARHSSGFIGRSNPDDPWGEFATPRFYTGSIDQGELRSAQTLSLWEDIEAVYIFAYQGRHSEGLRRAAEWVDPDFAHLRNHAAWWVADDHTPTWEEAIDRYHQLVDDGPGPEVFDMREMYDPEGGRYEVDPAQVNERHLKSEM